MSTDSRKTMIEINKMQEDFYSKKVDTSRNLIYKAWDILRKNGFWKYRKFLGIDDHVIELHKKWLGDLRDKKVLDLGCGAGNLLSPYLAKNAGKYVAIDLSEPLLKKLEARLQKQSITNYQIVHGDFLNAAFDVRDFDVIYAFGVMHHFKDFNELLNALHEKLDNDGIILTYDPVNMSFISRIMRAMYRPFQPDSEWEFPFEKKTFDSIQAMFRIVGVQGYFGKSKNIFPLYFLCGERQWVKNLSVKSHQSDLNKLSKFSPAVFKSLNVSLLLKKR